MGEEHQRYRTGGFPSGQDSRLPMQGPWINPWLGDERSHIPQEDLVQPNKINTFLKKEQIPRLKDILKYPHPILLKTVKVSKISLRYLIWED